MRQFMYVQVTVLTLMLQGCAIPPPPNSEANVNMDSEQTASPVSETLANDTEMTISQDQSLPEDTLQTPIPTAASTPGTNGPPLEDTVALSSKDSPITEHKGTKTSWEALRAKVTGEINEHQRQIQQLNLKLQLIDQIATRLELTTKAAFRKGQIILADFTIENPTTYDLKDISIACAQIAPTGTTISSYTETIYAIVGANATRTFERVELDSLHKQTQSLNCEIKNFTVHTPTGS